jgi:hypothetical protein
MEFATKALISTLRVNGLMCMTLDPQRPGYGAMWSAKGIRRGWFVGRVRSRTTSGRARCSVRSVRAVQRCHWAGIRERTGLDPRESPAYLKALPSIWRSIPGGRGALLDGAARDAATAGLTFGGLRRFDLSRAGSVEVKRRTACVSRWRSRSWRPGASRQQRRGKAGSSSRSGAFGPGRRLRGVTRAPQQHPPKLRVSFCQRVQHPSEQRMRKVDDRKTPHDPSLESTSFPANRSAVQTRHLLKTIALGHPSSDADSHGFGGMVTISAIAPVMSGACRFGYAEACADAASPTAAGCGWPSPGAAACSRRNPLRGSFDRRVRRRRRSRRWSIDGRRGLTPAVSKIVQLPRRPDMVGTEALSPTNQFVVLVPTMKMCGMPS